MHNSNDQKFPRRQVITSLLTGFTIASLAPFAAASSSDHISDALDTMKPLVGTTPNAPVETRMGTNSSLTELIDRPMLVNFWASWCPPCVHELPQLVKLDQALSEEGMAVMLVGVDRKGRIFAEEFLAERGITIPRAVHDQTGAVPRALEIKVMPTSFLVRPGGALIGKIEGPLQWDDPSVMASVASILKA